MENTTKELHTLRGELMLAAAVCINSLGVVLMLYSGAGISAISSVPFAFSEVLPRLTLGTWTYLFQGLLVLSLMFMRKRFVPPYLFSFVVGFVFGELLDFHEWWIGVLPTSLPMRYSGPAAAGFTGDTVGQSAKTHRVSGADGGKAGTCQRPLYPRQSRGRSEAAGTAGAV